MRFPILVVVAFCIIVSGSLAVECDFSGWPLPEIQPDGTILLDGSSWEIEERVSELMFVRVLRRLGTVTPEEPIFLSDEEALQMAVDFFAENGEALGIPPDVSVEVEHTQDEPLKVIFLGADQQYCESLPVVGTVAGAFIFESGQIDALGFAWYTPIELEDLDAKVTPEKAAAAGGGGGGGGGGFGDDSPKPTLAIMKCGGKFCLV